CCARKKQTSKHTAIPHSDSVRRITNNHGTRLSTVTRPCPEHETGHGITRNGPGEIPPGPRLGGCDYSCSGNKAKGQTSRDMIMLAGPANVATSAPKTTVMIV